MTDPSGPDFWGDGPLFPALDSEQQRSPSAAGSPAGTDPGGSPDPSTRANRADPARLLEGLNPQQRAAVIHRGGPVLVVAGAGSGKTRVLTRRIAWLVAEHHVHPGSILAITFTNKAAAEMRGRVTELVGNRARLMWVSTFHSACVRILRNEIGKLGFRRTFSIYDDADSRRLMQMICHDLNLDPKRHGPRAIGNWVSNLKNELVDVDAAGQRVATSDQGVWLAAYQEYQRRLTAANALDFDDLIMTSVHLLQAFPQVREQYRRRFRHVLVDEYQDTNHAQYALIQQLCGRVAKDGPVSVDADPGTGDPAAEGPMIEPPGLMVVGDSDQSIYAFRGATIRNIRDFDTDFPGAETILLEQNYRSTQNILSAANGVIGNNTDRAPKQLWSEHGEGPLITGYVADTEHDEAQFVADEIDALTAPVHGSTTEKGSYSDVAVFYRTNSQSRAFEEVFIRVGLPYKVVGGVRFYERREVRDALAYLRAIANPDDEVSIRRILNVPKRGIGDRAESAVEASANEHRISFSAALKRVDQVPGLATRSARQIKMFADFLLAHEKMVADGMPADQVLHSVLTGSGYLDELTGSTDPQDETRVENLIELISVAAEFVAAAAVIADGQDAGFGLGRSGEGAESLLDRLDADRLPGEGRAGSSRSFLQARSAAAEPSYDPDTLFGAWATDEQRQLVPDEQPVVGPAGEPATDAVSDEVGAPTPAQDAATEAAEAAELGDELADAAPEPDASLGAFLERIALVADSDQIPDADGGVVTLMTLHTAKGLEFDTVFLTGLEDGIFPHQRSIGDPVEVQEERRLAYVGITRARKRLYLSRAAVRTSFGSPQQNPPSRFLTEVPDRLVDWRRLADDVTRWESSSASARYRDRGPRGYQWNNTVGTGSLPRTLAGRANKAGPIAVKPGERVLHSTFGLGTVVATAGSGDSATADVDFGSAGLKRLNLRLAPLEVLSA